MGEGEKFDTGMPSKTEISFMWSDDTKGMTPIRARDILLDIELGRVAQKGLDTLSGETQVSTGLARAGRTVNDKQEVIELCSSALEGSGEASDKQFLEDLRMARELHSLYYGPHQNIASSLDRAQMMAILSQDSMRKAIPSPEGQKAMFSYMIALGKDDRRTRWEVNMDRDLNFDDANVVPNYEFFTPEENKQAQEYWQWLHSDSPEGRLAINRIKKLREVGGVAIKVRPQAGAETPAPTVLERVKDIEGMQDLFTSTVTKGEDYQAWTYHDVGQALNTRTMLMSLLGISPYTRFDSVNDVKPLSESGVQLSANALKALDERGSSLFEFVGEKGDYNPDRLRKLGLPETVVQKLSQVPGRKAMIDTLAQYATERQLKEMFPRDQEEFFAYMERIWKDAEFPLINWEAAGKRWQVPENISIVKFREMQWKLGILDTKSDPTGEESVIVRMTNGLETTLKQIKALLKKPKRK